MFKRSSAYLLVLGVGLCGLTAQTVWAYGPTWSSPYLSADEPDANKLLADRTKFVRENYQLPAAESDKIVQSLTGLVSVQERYLRESSLTLSRLRLAITLVGTDPAKSEPERGAKAAVFQGQYRRILSNAPMGLQNVVKLTEAALSTESIAPARAKIQAKFADAAKISGIPFAVENLDALAGGPLDPGPRPEVRLPDPTSPIAGAPPPPAQTPITKTVHPQMPAQPKIPQGPVPAPPRNIAIPPKPAYQAPPPPAPPVTQWPDLVKNLADKYELTPEQRTTVESVLTQSKARADDHRQRNQGSYDEAAKLSDDDAKMKKLQELNLPVDVIYDQMKQRVESIASIEQRNKAAQNEKAPKK